jgi:hypothetical protein
MESRVMVPDSPPGGTLADETGVRRHLRESKPLLAGGAPELVSHARGFAVAPV